MNRFSIMMASAALLLLVGAGCTPTQDAAEAPAGDAMEETEVSTEPIKIGWLGPLTGDISSVGVQMQDSVELAAKEVNESGGVNGRMLEVVYEDGGCDSKKSSSAGSKLVNVDKVFAIIGGVCSGETLAVAPVTEENQVIMISPASTAPSVSDAGDYIFRVVPSDAYQGKFGAEYAYNELGKRKAAILFAKTDYTEGLATTFKTHFENLGGEVVVEDSFLQTARDLRTQLTKVKNSGADVVYFLSYTEAAVVGFRQMEELGIDVTVLGADTFGEELVQQADGAEGTYFTLPKSELDEAFRDKFLAETDNEDMQPYVTQSYDAVMILVDAMKKVGVDSEAVKNELYTVSGYNGVSGMITFDEKGDLANAEYDVFVVKDGTSAPVTE